MHAITSLQDYQAKNTEQLAMTILRLSLALIISLRGWHRLFFEGQAWLIEQFSNQGMPLANLLAYAISLSEALAGLALLLAWRIKPAAIWLLLNYLVWGALLQRHNGWFDLGSDQYGLECTALISVALFSLILYQAANTQKWAIVVLRYFTALFVMLHGWHRIDNGGWVDWGTYLSQQGWPFAITITAAITALEAFAAPVFAWARWPELSRLLGFFYCALYSMAIYLHHWQFGWFLKPEGQNGVEAAVLLLACFVCAILTLPEPKPKLSAKS